MQEGHFSSMGYLAARIRLAKKYGKNYFPIQEVKEELINYNPQLLPQNIIPEDIT